MSSLVEAGKNPLETAKKYAAGRKAVGHLLTDVPVEILHSLGLYPVLIYSHGGAAGRGREHFQSFTCTYGRGSLDLLLDGTFSFLHGVITPFICDTTRCVDIVLREQKPVKFVECFRPPKSQTGPSAYEYLVGELKRFSESIASWDGLKVNEQAIADSISIYNKARGLLRRAEALREISPDVYFDVCRAFTVLPVEVFIEAAEKEIPQLLEGLRAEKNKGATKKVRIILAGKMPEPRGLPHAVSAMGGSVVGDDMAVGARLFARDVEESDDVFGALAKRQLNQIPFAGLLQPLEDRPDFLIRLARERKADGVILLTLKFCEIFELDAPEVRERLTKENISTLVLETDIGEALSGPARTRLEAFLEMLQHG